MRLSVVTALAALLATGFSVDVQVTLPYATYRGAVSQSDANINYWWGLAYAAPPTGSLRFAAPQDPLNVTGVTTATAHKPICLGYPGHANFSDTSFNEDCLYLDVVAPANASASTPLPVYFYIQGGGFATESQTYSAGKLIAASGYEIVVVQLNYRLGPYGFLGGNEVLADATASTNNGLKDQRKALEWVQKYISQFGGDPTRVTLGGASAGGQSVLTHLVAYGGRNDDLFHGAAVQSATAPVIYSVAAGQFEFDALLQRTGCSDLACLRGLDAHELQPANYAVTFPGAPGPPAYSYNPMIDGDFLTDLPITLFQKGSFVQVPLLIGDDENEGTEFTPVSTNSYSDGNTNLKKNLPNITDDMFTQINGLWPVADFPQSFPQQPSGAGQYWRQASTVFGDIRYICPNLLVAEAFSNASMPTWSYLYNVTTSDSEQNGYGAVHTSEISTIWGNSLPTDSPNLPEEAVMQGYWTSFIKTLDPSKERASASPAWNQYSNNSPQRMRLRTSQNEMQAVDDVVQQRCQYWRSIAVEISQ